MDNQYINILPVPACTVNPEGIVTAANPLIKNVFVYEDISGHNFFTLTGFKREQLMDANTGELILERNDKVFKLWINEEAKDDEDIVVFFDEATVRESYRSKLDSDKAVIAYINIDNYDELVASAPEDYRRVIPAQIDGLVRKWAAHFNSPVISTDDDTPMAVIKEILQGIIETMERNDCSLGLILDLIR